MIAFVAEWTAKLSGLVALMLIAAWLGDPARDPVVMVAGLCLMAVFVIVCAVAAALDS